MSIIDPSMKSYARAELVAQNAIFAFDGEFRFLSNFGEGEVEIYGIPCRFAENAFAVAKIDPNGGVHPRAAALKEMRRIGAMTDPGEAKRAGRRRVWLDRPFLRADWEAVKIGLVTEIVRRKFFANARLAAKLLATGDRLLVEGNTWGDRIWGMVERDGRFSGANLLGQILMLIRDELRAAEAAKAA